MNHDWPPYYQVQLSEKEFECLIVILEVSEEAIRLKEGAKIDEAHLRDILAKLQELRKAGAIAGTPPTAK